MAQTNYTPIQLYYSSTASAVPVNTNLASGELAINITDGILFYKDNAGTVQKIGYKLTPTTAGGTGLTSFTANGIVYASSTSALTTGSALTFDGTNFSLGGGTALSLGGYQSLNLNGSTSGILNIKSNGTDNFWLFSDGSNQFIDARVGSQIYRLGGTEQMRLTSTGLGIGTSSPTNALSVSGNANITGNTTLGDASTDTVTVNGYMGVGGAGDASRAINVTSSALTGANQTGVYSALVGSASATSTVRGFTALVQTAAASFTAADVAGFWYAGASKGAGSTITNSHGLYIPDLTAGVNNYGITSLVSSGSNKWNLYVSGSAPSYFAGNVGIGTTTINYDGWGRAVSTMSATQAVFESASSRTTANTLIGGWSAVQTNNSSASQFRVASVEAYNTGATANNTGGYLTFNTKADGTAAIAERLRIDQSGNLGIGTSSPDEKLDVNGNAAIGSTANAYNEIRFFNSTATAGTTRLRASANDILFFTGNAERLRIDSSGNVGIAQTDPTNNGISGYTNLVIGNSTSTTAGITIRTANTGTPAPGIVFARGTGGANGKVYYDQSTDRLYCQAGGSGGVYLASTGTSWTSASDERVKDIIEPIENATQKLANWRTVIGKYKSDTDGVRRSFLIAQDVLTTFPEAVNTDKAEEYGLNYQDLIPLLVASIQELKAEFDAYKASHP